MISWHKPGQKVVCVGDGGPCWLDGAGNPTSGPEKGEICTIFAVENWFGEALFRFAEYPFLEDKFDADEFRPVCPDIIDQLRNFDAPVPSDPVRVKEEV